MRLRVRKKKKITRLLLQVCTENINFFYNGIRKITINNTCPAQIVFENVSGENIMSNDSSYCPVHEREPRCETEPITHLIGPQQ